MGKLKRSEALTVLHEIYRICSQIGVVSAVSLDMQAPHEPDSYIITLKCTLDEPSRSQIKQILKEHNLALKEEKEQITIY